MKAKEKRQQTQEARTVMNKDNKMIVKRNNNNSTVTARKQESNTVTAKNE